MSQKQYTARQYSGIRRNGTRTYRPSMYIGDVGVRGLAPFGL